MSIISLAFKPGHKAFIPYIMAGDPDIEGTITRVKILQDCGSDIIELGVPFSDPLADGPTIQQSAIRALQSKTNLEHVLEMVSKIRTFCSIPIVLMTYYNIIFKYGEERFIKDAVRCGVNGAIIPDLPPEEAFNYRQCADAQGLDTVFLCAPTTDIKRARQICKATRGFLYYVSMTGITGSNLVLSDEIKSHILALRKFCKVPIAVGFGVSTPQQASVIAEFADGVIVGSAIVKKFHEDINKAKEFVLSLRNSIK